MHTIYDIQVNRATEQSCTATTKKIAYLGKSSNNRWMARNYVGGEGVEATARSEIGDHTPCKPWQHLDKASLRLERKTEWSREVLMILRSAVLADGE